MNNDTTHYYYLNKLAKPHHLRMIDEPVSDLRAIIKEPEWYHEHRMNTMPDLLLFYGHSNTVIELKGSKAKRGKAIKQITSGIEFLVEELYIPPESIKGKFVIYFPRGYRYETTHERGIII